MASARPAGRAGETAGRPQWVSFLSDYGLDDVFVGVCKGVMARIAPDLKIIDICHQVPPQDVAQGAVTLASAVPYLPPAVHLALVDPMGDRPARAVGLRATDGSLFVGPDNGLLMDAADALGGVVSAHELTTVTLWLPNPSRTFRGRDVFAPVAAYLATGTRLEEIGPAVALDSLVRLRTREAVVDEDHVHAEVRSVDHFGNLSLNVARSDLEAAGIALGDVVELRCGGRSMTVPFTLTYGEVPAGRLALSEDSFRAVTLAVNKGHAAQTLRVTHGDPIVISRLPRPART